MNSTTPNLRLPSQPQRTVTAPWPVLIFRPAEGRRLGWPEWLQYIPPRRHTVERSPIPVLTRIDVEQLRRRDERRYLQAKPAVVLWDLILPTDLFSTPALSARPSVDDVTG